MAASNRATKSLMASDSADLHCDQCLESGLYVIAGGLCDTCNDFLCNGCITQHKTLRGFKTHRILRGVDMPERRPMTTEVDRCPKHPDRAVEIYCLQESAFGCLRCMTWDHKTCQGVAPVADFVSGFNFDSELSNIKKYSTETKELVTDLKRNIAKCLSNNTQFFNESLHEFRIHKEEILAALENKEADISTKAENIMRANEANLKKLLKSIKMKSEQVDSNVLNIDAVKKLKQKDQLFVAIKTCGQRMEQISTQLSQLGTQIRIQKFIFAADPSLKDAIGNNIDIKLETSAAPATICTAVSQIDVKSDEDNTDCYINGIAEISDTEIVLSDFANNCLKVVDVNNYIITQRRQLDTSPGDITLVPEASVAVTHPDVKQIAFYTADKDLKYKRRIVVGGRCLGICYNNNRLIVSYIHPEPTIQIIDMKGEVLKTIKHGEAGDALFDDPLCLAVSPDSFFICVSDWEKNTVTCINTTGQIQWLYTDKELKRPLDIATGHGCLYVCSRDTSTIHVVSADGEKLSVISQDQSGVSHPRAVHYCTQTRTLYLSSALTKPNQSNSIKRLMLQ